MSKFNLENQPQLCLLKPQEILAIHEKAVAILAEIGVIFECEAALDLLAQAGCTVDKAAKTVKFTEESIIAAVNSAPESFALYNRAGNAALMVGGGGQMQIVPAVSATAISLEEGQKTRSATSVDLAAITKIEDTIEQYQLLAPAVVCSDIPPIAGDAYRNYIMLKYTDKPFISEAWGVEGIRWTQDLLVALRGSAEEAAAKPSILIGLCPITPLKWSFEAAQNLIDAVHYGIPINICVCPMLGSGSPITIAGALAIQMAEFLSGLVLAQTIQPRAKIVFGGYTTSMDMKTTVASMTAMEATMAVAAHGAMANYYGVPSQTFAACSEAKTLDYQGGWETAVTGLLAVQAGINLIYGAGSGNFLLDFSYEKLLMDAEIAKAYYFYAQGIQISEEAFLMEDIKEVCPGGSFLMSMSTLMQFKEHQCYYSNLVDRNNRDAWEKKGKLTMAANAAAKVQAMLDTATGSPIAKDLGEKLDTVVLAIAEECGCELPLVD
jgi:trimethylamine--corrinoid protein Co-methyltransferase